MSRLFVRAAFNLPRRGYVVAGEIMEGRIDKGMSLYYPLHHEVVALEIIAVEIVDIDRENQVAYLILEQVVIDEKN